MPYGGWKRSRCDGMTRFFDLTMDRLELAIGALGNERYRARQLFQWIYQKEVVDFGEMTNISKSLRLLFSDMFDTSLPAVREVRTSQDGSTKFALSGWDGLVIESVLIPEKDRNTLCISSQIGCRMGCRFCVTGQIGFIRNLEVSEIVGQVMAVKKWCAGRRITNLVFMGMGEPLDNRDNLFKALTILKEPFGLDFSHRRITISSVGLVDGLRLIEPKMAGLAISLNAADNETRNLLMPINRLYPLEEVMRFIEGFKSPNRERITLEYVMIRGINDSLDDAKKLVALLKRVRCKINLIPYNESDRLEFQSPDAQVVRRFQEYLLGERFTAIVRDSRGGDVGGACGQLGIEYLKEKRNGDTSCL